MNIAPVLTALGLSEKEAAVYLATLELSMAPVSIIARKAKLNRTTTYEILAQLLQRGLAECFPQKSMKVYSVVSPRELHRKYTDHIHELGAVLPEMMAICNTIYKKPRITYYEGKEELRRLYLDVLKAPGEALNYFLPEKPFQYFGEEWVYREHIAERVRRGIHLRVIMPQSAYVKRYVERGTKELRETRVIQEKDLFFTNETYIYGDRMSTFSFDEDFAVLVESTDIARTQRVLFELAWKSALVK